MCSHQLAVPHHVFEPSSLFLWNLFDLLSQVLNTSSKVFRPRWSKVFLPVES